MVCRAAPFSGFHLRFTGTKSWRLNDVERTFLPAIQHHFTPTTSGLDSFSERQPAPGDGLAAPEPVFSSLRNANQHGAGPTVPASAAHSEYSGRPVGLGWSGHKVTAAHELGLQQSAGCIARWQTDRV